MVTVPWLRHEALDAAIAQAEANVRAAQAMQRQTRSNLSAQVVMDLATLRDADRQLNLFEGLILPRATQGVTLRDRLTSQGIQRCLICWTASTR